MSDQVTISLNQYQKRVLFFAAVSVGISLFILPVMVEYHGFDSSRFSFLEYVAVSSFLSPDSGFFAPRYTVNVLVLAAEWVMIGICTAFGVWISGKIAVKSAE
jgi:hypothetical protein